MPSALPPNAACVALIKGACRCDASAMDFQLEAFVGALAARVVTAGIQRDPFDREAGDVRLLCGHCRHVVAFNLSFAGIRRVVFQCLACGGLSAVGHRTVDRSR